MAQIMRSMEVARDGSFSLRAKTWTDNIALTAGGGEALYTVPAGAAHVVFSANGDFYANYDLTASVPSSAILDGSSAELNPVVRRINDVAVIHLISPSGGATNVTVKVYQD
jgi:hypothetical protein